MQLTNRSAMAGFRSRLFPLTLLALLSVIVTLPAAVDSKPGTDKAAAATQTKQKKEAAEVPKRVIDPKKITWLNFADGLKYSRAEKKHVLLDFTASWCGWCKKMDADAFSDSAVISMINDNFIPVKVWADSDEKLDIDGQLVPQSAISQDMFRVQGFPTFHFLRPSDQKMIRGFSGYRDKDFMYRILEYVKNEQYDTSKTHQKAPDASTGK